MITLQAIISLGIFFFITCILPIVLIVYSIKKNLKNMIWITLGICLFLLPQIIFRIPVISSTQSKNPLLNNFWVDLIVFKGISSGVIEEISKLIGILLICKLNKINRENVFNFFLGYGLCELFVLFGLTSCRLFVNSILIGYNVYPSLNLQTNEAVLLIESINNSQFIPMIFSLIERICTLLFHYSTIYFLANCKDIKKALFISITIHSVFNIIGIFFINYVNSYIGRIILIILTYIIYRFVMVSNERKWRI